MSIELITIILFLSFIFFLSLGLPIVFILGGLAMIFTLLFWKPASLYLIAPAAFSQTTSVILMAAPLFVFMANVLQFSGLGEALYRVMYLWFGSLRGGLAVGSIVMGAVLAAMCGISGAGILTIGILAVPSMLNYKYDRKLAMGTVGAGGLLGLLIPPSIIVILYGSIAKESVGALFMGAVIPGILLTFLYILYIIVKCYLQPDMGPALPQELRVSWREKIVSLKSVIVALVLILVVLGSIYRGICTPTEASGIGAVGALIAAAIHRKLNWKNVSEALDRTLRLIGMVFWLLIAATYFSNLFAALGAQELIIGITGAFTGSPWLIIVLMQVSLLFLGMFMDDFAIIVLVTPIYVPIIQNLGFDPLWFGILFIMNMNISYLTPPYGFDLFYLKGLASTKGVIPEDQPPVTMGEIYQSVVPFIVCQIICLVLVMVFPKLATWLPYTMVHLK